MGIIAGLQEGTRNESIIVGTSSIIISPPRNTTPERKVIVVRNNSNDPLKIITIGFGNQGPAINGAGIILKQFESFTDSADGNYNTFQGQINAISAIAGATLAIMER